jgi:FAD-dependent oxidoreductase domain-containing protein 1
MFRNTFTSLDNLVLSDTSINFYMDIEQSGVDLGIRKTGYLWVMSERQLSVNEKHIEKMENKGIELKRYDRRDLEHALPLMRTKFESSDEESKLLKLEDVAGAILGVKCGRLVPDKLSRFYADEFVKMGGKIAFNTNVRSLLVEPNEPLQIEGEPFVWQESKIAGATVEGQIEGELRGKTTVIAAGVWNNEILDPIGIDGHVKGKKRQLFTVPARGKTELTNLIYNKNFSELGVLPFVILPKAGCYLKALEENKEFWVTCEDELNQPFVNVPDRELENYKAELGYYERNVYPILKGYFPQFENAKPSQMWAGLYSYNTLDSIPFVFVENGMIVAGGGSGSGIMKGDAMGRIVDSSYRMGDRGEAILYGEVNYSVSKIGFKSRQVEREEWVI